MKVFGIGWLLLAAGASFSAAAQQAPALTAPPGGPETTLNGTVTPAASSAPLQSPAAPVATPSVTPAAMPSSVAATPAVAPSSASEGNAPPLATIPSASAANAGKLADVLLVPTSANTTSLLFSKNDIGLITPFIAKYESLKDTESGTVENDDLSSLLDTIKTGKSESAPVPPPLPALYLGSIVYYSPSLWSVWVNGKKLLNTHNDPHNEFYVSRISRTEAELIWKPASLQNVPVIWKALTQNGTVSLPNVIVDTARGTITLLMHPNQTFLPRSLAIREGLVKSINTVPVAANPGGESPPAPNAPQPKYQMPH